MEPTLINVQDPNSVVIIPICILGLAMVVLLLHLYNKHGAGADEWY